MIQGNTTFSMYFRCRDLIAGIAMALAAPNSYVSTLMHLVQAEEPNATPASISETFLKAPTNQIELPEEALPFKIP